MLQILVKPKKLGNLVKFTEFNSLRIRFERLSRKRKLGNGALKLWIRCQFLLGNVLMMIGQLGSGNIDFLLCKGLLLIYAHYLPPTQSPDNVRQRMNRNRSIAAAGLILGP